MQFDPERAFPYPVLRAGVDDYVRGQFQSSVEFLEGADGHGITMEVVSQLNVPSILKEIQEKRAEYQYILTCRDTFTRFNVRSSHPDFTHEFPEGQLRGEVKVYNVVAACKVIENFTCKHINDEFGKGPFRFEPGEILAYSEPTVVYLQPESFKPLVSIFEISPNESLDRYDMEFFTAEDRIRIELSPHFKESVDTARTDPTKQAVLFNSVYFHAVVDALDKLRLDPEGDQTWKKVILSRMKQLELEPDQLKNGELFKVANTLLQRPLSRIDAFFSNDEGAS